MNEFVAPSTQQSEKIPASKSFWTFPRFLMANGLMLLFLVFGLQVRGVPSLTGFFLGFTVSSVLVWYFVLGLIWWLILASYGTSELKKRNYFNRHPAGVVLSAWVFALIPAWLLFVFGMGFYVTVNMMLA